MQVDVRRDGPWGELAVVGRSAIDLAESPVPPTAGIGLRLASRIAAAHDGTLRASVTPTGSLRVSLTIPVSGPASVT